MQRRRPLGVTILAILIVLGGVGEVVGGLIIVTLRGISIQFSGAAGAGFLVSESWGALLIGAGLASFFMAYGFLKGNRLTYWLTVIFSSFGILFGGLSINLLSTFAEVGAIISLISLFFFLFFALYMTNFRVKEFFGMSERISKAELDEMRDIAPRLNEAELEEMLRDNPRLTEAEREEIREAAKVMTPEPEEEQVPTPSSKVETPLDVKICSNKYCNYPNKPEHRYCIKCGNRLPSRRKSAPA